MSKPLKPKKKRYPKNPEPQECYACGSKNIERLPCHGVGVIRICKDCREQQA